MENSKSLFEPAFFEQAGSHVVVSQPNLRCHVIFKAFGIHELGSFLKVAQRLVKVLSLTVYRGAQKQQFCHVVEKFEAFSYQLQSEKAVALKNSLGCFLVKFFGPRFLDG